jgi:hypothetical protein
MEPVRCQVNWCLGVSLELVVLDYFTRPPQNDEKAEEDFNYLSGSPCIR